MTQQPNLQEPLVRPSDTLTPREREIVAGVVAGEHDREIATRLNISSHTVRSHLRSTFIKLGVWNRVGLAVYIVSHGIETTPAAPTPILARVQGGRA